MLWAFLSNDLLLYMPDLLRLFLFLWLFAVGSCVGSFLNVVVLRMPAGIGIAREGSRCPVCLHAIRWYDNIPILSWLILRGRCRDCRTPISARYPAVELIVALLFVTLGSAEGLSGGASLPVPLGAPRYHPFTPLQIWSIYTLHVVVVVTVLGAALIQRDGQRVALRLFYPTLLAGVVGALILPALHPVSALAWTAPSWVIGLTDVLCGCLAGLLLGVAVWPAAARQPLSPAAGRVALLAVVTVGMALGWQLLSGVVVLAAVGYWLTSIMFCRSIRRSRGPWLFYLVVSMVLHLVAWRWLTQHVWLLGQQAPWWSLVVALPVVALLSRWAAQLVPRRELEQAKERARKKETSMSEPIDREANLKAILDSPSYLPVESDAEFLQQWETRPVRVQLELLKPEIGLMRQGVESTIVVFGGTQVVELAEAETRLRAARALLAEQPDNALHQRAVARTERIVAKARYYAAARDFGKLVSSRCQVEGKCDYVIVTGGGPGIMEAANRGAYEVGAKSIGLNITLPAEQVPNPYITPELCFQFHYFALRKMHFLLRAKAMVVFPGGFGTLDELFDALTLRQTRRMQEIPIILFGRAFWEQVINFQFLADEGVIADRDLELLTFVDTPEEAWKVITEFHHQREG